MKAICISCFDYYETRIKGIIEYFDSKNYEVRYLISDFNHFSKSKYKADYGGSKQLNVISYKKNLSISRLLSHMQYSKKVTREIKRFKPDVIYCIIPPNSLVKDVGKYKLKNRNVKLIFDIYDMWPESFPYRTQNHIIKFLFSKWAMLRDEHITDADRIIVVSNKSKEDIDKKYHLNAKVLFPCISLGDVPNYSFDISKKIEFLYLGHVNHITDIELGTEFLGSLSRSREVILHIIGEGQNRERWISMLRQVGIKTICHGVVFDENEKKKIFQMCNFGLNIPRKEINSSMSLKSIEYLHFGLPFINSGLGDNETLVIDNEIGFNMSDKNVVDRILNMTSNELMLMSHNCINCYVSKFLSQDYDSIFGDIL